MMKLKENQEKKCHIPVGMERKSSTPKPLGYRAIAITERYNLYSTSDPDKLVASKQQRELL